MLFVENANSKIIKSILTYIVNIFSSFFINTNFHLAIIIKAEIHIVREDSITLIVWVTQIIKFNCVKVYNGNIFINSKVNNI